LLFDGFSEKFFGFFALLFLIGTLLFRILIKFYVRTPIF
jgi:hypothetical protein